MQCFGCFGKRNKRNPNLHRDLRSEKEMTKISNADSKTDIVEAKMGYLTVVKGGMQKVFTQGMTDCSTYTICTNWDEATQRYQEILMFHVQGSNINRTGAQDKTDLYEFLSAIERNEKGNKHLMYIAFGINMGIAGQAGILNQEVNLETNAGKHIKDYRLLQQCFGIFGLSNIQFTSSSKMTVDPNGEVSNLDKDGYVFSSSQTKGLLRFAKESQDIADALARERELEGTENEN